MDKKQAIQVLETIATYMEIKGENPFKIAAYRRAAQALEQDGRTLAEMDDPKAIPGIGQATADVIQELKETGASSLLNELAQQLPAGLLPLLTIPGLGGKKVGKLYRELGITDAESLLQAAKAGQIRALAGFGKKSEDNMIEALAVWNVRPERLPVADVLPFSEQLEQQIADFHDVIRFSRAGSLRRMRETVKDLDYIIATDNPSSVKDQILQLEGIANIIAKGNGKVSVELDLEEHTISVDFRLVPNEAFATALHHFTGSKDHNVRMRQLAKKRGEKINEYGIETVETGAIKTFPDERAFFAHFGLPYISPEAREDGSELERYRETAEEVSFIDAKADLHMHTTWSDGAHSLEEMAEAAKKRGYTHIAITDHSRYLKVANGLSIERLKQQHEYIREYNQQNNGITILTGIEMDILPSGELDYPDELLSEIDFVIASIHSAFSQSEEKLMERLQAAIFNPHVDLVAHPTGRLIGKRKGYAVDVPTLIQWASEAGCALELNASPRRLDLEVTWLKLAAETGVPIAINSDAHRIGTLANVEYGYAHARKAMLLPDQVLNTWPLEKLQHWLKRKH
ncbi:DNA polymerase/3'-5' exonuclease PolX [Shouchella clausii]|uniref:DNA-directed DNA polymerase n=1 Tax=Shouchella clausii TaxID=79880 RepID=A0A268S338_SHOCL|nr:DNA polymerase/3'-5' exonuclease PolX [Shouchella clausii]PAD41930.1 DNA polymerase/3'-5' exonuclease PolX [Bacillus sp. 7520-S]SPU21877.1 DNA-directed DNA polymerase X [Niallia circulans]AST97052.1 DNA polymerase/3'-5' exonuclease PolX [Shouchella clausii]MBU8594591.1 DNA polymerase/3'-5' exonuclease PolX [Shouchella clausii]MCM3547448.1 DNA polymerase/3'-5' exonuclease PolX [Shouchella clausii]